MKRNRIVSLIFGAVLASGLVACQDGAMPMGPDAASSIATPQASAAWAVVSDRNSGIGGVTAVIGSEGGELKLGNQSLVVPAGAVDAPTVFRMRKSSEALRVELTATRVTPNDVGSAGFARPLTLNFRYGHAASLPGDPSDLQIVWVRPDGTFEPQPTDVDEVARVVSGQIDHFSEYAMASN